MRPISRTVVATALLSLCGTGVARAGMPYFPLTEWTAMLERERTLGLTTLTRQRLEAVSFFLAGILIAALLIRWIWNGLRSDFPALPRLSIGKAVGLVILWGLLFVLVLTMISGARELMTPGAWKRTGYTYTLIATEPPPPDPADTRRREAMRRVWEHLEHGKKGNQYPPRSEIAEDAWRVPGLEGQRYVYIEGRRDDEDGGEEILVCEPEGAGDLRYVLTTSGAVRLMPGRWITRQLEREPRRP